MHPHADETSRPPRRRALGRGGGVSGAAQEPPTTAAPAPAPPTGPTRAPEPQPAPTEPAPTEPAPTEPAPTGPAPTEPASTEPEPTEPETESSAPRPGSEPDEGPGGVPASEGLEDVPGGVPASEGPEGVPGGVPASEGPEGVPGGVPASEGPEGAPGDASASGGGGAGGRFTVRLANFEGPFDLLLQLITKHKLDVTEVALSQVTDEFMAHLRGLGPDGDLDQTTEFLVVAATLLDLKTARLLPAAEVEDEADLALLEARDLLFARLLQYRAYKRIAEIFAERWEAEGRRHPRTVGLEPHHAELLPEVVLTIGAEGLAKLAVKAMRPRAAPQVYVDHIHAPLVSVREQAGIVAALLRERGTLDFRELVEDAAGDTLTVVARFLALLELYREKAVALDQEDALGRLTVSWTGGDGETRVTQEFDQEDPSA
ncbi:segregation and condensation protein A [Streptomyces hydrogenans]|uniref:segregation and condensation protein A n=1 Tax=Streptomyces hydrogenans TaxID=1873719 RepID=UPI003827CD31